ncbi:MAG: HNH endonuclease [bacterium]|nr:HNH endonuclease [bacterium]MCW5891642.1 HNH endonuclease [bacterium]
MDTACTVVAPAAIEPRALVPDGSGPRRHRRAVSEPALVVALVPDVERRRALAARFWRYVRRGDLRACWPWVASTNLHGTARFKIDGSREVPAPRVAWLLVHGGVPLGCIVKHLCADATCCNPSHLTLDPPVRPARLRELP